MKFLISLWIGLCAVSASASLVDDCVKPKSANTEALVRGLFISAKLKPILSSNECTKLSEKLVGVKILDLSSLRLSDISVLSTWDELENMEVLNLSGNALESVAGLENFRKLTTLILAQNKIADARALRSLSGLKTVDLATNKIQSTQTFREFTALENLNLSQNRVADVRPLGDIKQLRSLVLSDNPVSDISSLSGLWDLRFLSIANTSVKDTRSLEALELLHADSNGQNVRLQVVGKPRPHYPPPARPIPCPRPCHSCW